MAKQRMPPRARQAFGRRLRDARRGMRLSQAEAARRLGLEHFSTLANYEQGRAEVPLVILPDLAALYRISIPELFGVRPAVDLPTRVHYAHLHQETEALVKELARLTERLAALYTTHAANGTRRRA